MNAHTPIKCPFCDIMPRKERYAQHLQTKHTKDLGLQMMDQWIDNKPGCLLDLINKGITSLSQLQYFPVEDNVNISVIFAKEARIFDSDNDGDLDKKIKYIKDKDIADEHYKFLTETCFKELDGFDVFRKLNAKVNNSLEMAELKKQNRLLQKQVTEKPTDAYDELKQKNDELEYEIKKFQFKLSEEQDNLYETKYNDCRSELITSQRELQYYKNEINTIHKHYSENMERRSNASSDEALLRDMAEWEKKKKKESSIVEKLEKEVKTLREEIKKKEEDYKSDMKKYKKSIEKYKKQILKMMASKLEDSDRDDVSSVAS